MGNATERPARGGRRVFAAIVLTVVLLIAVPVTAGVVEIAGRLAEGAASAGDPSFYTPPTPLPAGQPGDVIRTERLDDGPEGALAWRVLYHSTDASGADIAVSGTIVAPVDAAKEGDRTVVSWAHPTTGTAPRCAPSIGVDPFDLIEGLDRLLAAGYVVAATDYAGMGAPGSPSFLIGDTEAANVLDIARAAQHVDGTGASDRVVLWGHSQGGHASLFAAARAPAYSPDLEVQAVAVAAPATDLASLLSADIGDVSGVTIGAYAFDSYATAYASSLPADPLAAILTQAGADAVPGMADLCLIGQNSQLHDIADPLIGSFLAHDPTTVPGWKDVLAQNAAPTSRLDVPLFVAQGASDTLVRPAVTASYVVAQQAAGTDVTSETYPGVGHGEIALKALDALLPWLADRAPASR
ncbi:alpha/beta fold hydrolase [Humibacter sp. BT305]|nr:alpha/beta fold hydrolase [Humibacter sp. BT305]